jgi:hypothetical protein
MRYLLLVPFIVTGCATHSLQNPYNFSGFDNTHLCKSAKWVYATHNQEGVINPYLAENAKRNLLTKDEFDTVFKKPAVAGDSKCYIIATGGDQALLEANLKATDPNKYDYQIGMRDGCESGNAAGGSITSKQSKNVELYINNAYYKNGYDDAYSECKNKSDQLNRAITDSLNRGW